jgi:hypothetical protein
MARNFLPRYSNGVYRGHALAVWILGLVLLLKVLVSVNAIVNGNTMAHSGDGIPLGTFPPEAVQAIISLFAIWGMTYLVIGVTCLLVLAWYRALIPVAFTLLLVEHLSRLVILHFLPISETGPTGESAGISPFPYGFLALILVGLAFSLWRRDTSTWAALR